MADHGPVHGYLPPPPPINKYRPVPVPAYEPAPQPAYKPVPQPTYKPAPAYKPASTHDYKPTNTPVYKPTPTYNHENTAYKAAPSYKEPEHEPIFYSYGYDVNDSYSGVDFGQNESRDGYTTSGKYYVQLPDGRLQTVTYKVDDYSGYVADVSYTGEAKYVAAAKRPGYGPAL